MSQNFRKDNDKDNDAQIYSQPFKQHKTGRLMTKTNLKVTFDFWEIRGLTQVIKQHDISVSLSPKPIILHL